MRNNDLYDRLISRREALVQKKLQESVREDYGDADPGTITKEHDILAALASAQRSGDTAKVKELQGKIQSGRFESVDTVKVGEKLWVSRNPDAVIPDDWKGEQVVVKKLPNPDFALVTSAKHPGREMLLPFRHLHKTFPLMFEATEVDLNKPFTDTLQKGDIVHTERSGGQREASDVIQSVTADEIKTGAGSQTRSYARRDACLKNGIKIFRESTTYPGYDAKSEDEYVKANLDAKRASRQVTVDKLKSDIAQAYRSSETPIKLPVGIEPWQHLISQSSPSKELKPLLVSLRSAMKDIDSDTRNDELTHRAVWKRMQRNKRESVDEKGLPKGEFWKQQGKTPWGSKPGKKSGAKAYHFTPSKTSDFSKLKPDQKKQVNSKLKLGYLQSTFRKKGKKHESVEVFEATGGFSLIHGEEMAKGTKIEFEHGDKNYTGTLVRDNWQTMDVKLDQDITSTINGKTFKKGTTIQIIKTNIKKMGESELNLRLRKGRIEEIKADSKPVPAESSVKAEVSRVQAALRKGHVPSDRE